MFSHSHGRINIKAAKQECYIFGLGDHLEGRSCRLHTTSFHFISLVHVVYFKATLKALLSSSIREEGLVGEHSNNLYHLKFP